MNAPVSAPKQYDRRNEVAQRSYIEDEFANKYDKRMDLIVPPGMKLGFNGTGGEQAVLQFDAGAFEIVIDGVTVISLATDASVTTLEGRVTTAEGEIDTAQAAIITNAGNISTVNGKLVASYAMTLDVNGRISGVKHLNDGVTSSVKYLATTFQVYNGTTDEAPFEVVGGVVKIKTANVGALVADNITTGTLAVARIADGTLDYLKLAIGAITVAADFENDGSVTVGSSFTQVSTVTISTADANTRVLVMFSNYIDSSTDGSLMDAQIKRNGSVIWGPKAIAGDPPGFSYTFDTEGLVEYTPAFSGMVSAFDTDVPGSAGSYTYTLELRVAGSVSVPWDVTYRRLLALAFKR